MALSDGVVEAVIAVSEMDKAKGFYEDKLGLSGGTEEGDGGVTYTCGEGSKIHVYPSPGNAGKSGATLAGWVVGDVDATVDELAGNGVTFEQYDEGPLKTNEKGIAEMGEIRSAWFKDPDGNIMAVANR
jgi:catechol 2,3-dioxygenase-like lactoylglutathione lyase family enzyme